MTRPDIQAPGLTWQPRKGGWEARWKCRTDLRERGYTPKSVRLWGGQTPSDLEREWIAERCRQLQDEMLVWGRGGIPRQIEFDGTITSLIRCYRTDADSPYHKGRYHTRLYKDRLMAAVERDIGDKLVTEMKARELKRWHEKYVDADKIAMGHSVVGILRTLASFGFTLLESDECERLGKILHEMRFTMPKARNERLTADMAIAIRAEANKQGLHSIALAQAIQFELMLRQKDVIGEWVPIEEKTPPTDVFDGNWKWLRGIRWNEINENFILTHVTSKRQKEITVDLKLAPMVVEELGSLRRNDFGSSGPVIVHEKLEIPWEGEAFRRAWRRCSDAAGVPKSVRNMDSRAGAISEATDAGADLEHVRQAATHSDIGMTQRYSRNATEKTAGVQVKRVAHRNKPGPE